MKPLDGPYQTIFKSFQELKSKKGFEVGLSKWITIDQSMISQFAKLTGDSQWIHVDEERASNESPYGCTIAHGLLTLSLTPKLFYECIKIEEIGFGLNYGYDKVRFISPVLVGSMVRGRVKLLEIEDQYPSVKLKWQITLELKDSAKPACVADTILLVIYPDN